MHFLFMNVNRGAFVLTIGRRRLIVLLINLKQLVNLINWTLLFYRVSGLLFPQ